MCRCGSAAVHPAWCGGNRHEARWMPRVVNEPCCKAAGVAGDGGSVGLSTTTHVLDAALARHTTHSVEARNSVCAQRDNWLGLTGARRKHHLPARGHWEAFVVSCVRVARAGVQSGAHDFRVLGATMPSPSPLAGTRLAPPPTVSIIIRFRRGAWPPWQLRRPYSIPPRLNF